MKLFILLALAIALNAEDAPKLCLDGQGPLQPGQVYCSDLYVSPLTPVEFTSVVPFIGSYYGLYVTAEKGVDLGDARRKMKAECEKQKAHCALIEVVKDDKIIAELDMDGVWHKDATDEEIADALMVMLRGFK
jgi:hypothetical protein